MLGLNISVTGCVVHQRRQSGTAVPFKVVILGQSEDFYVISPGKNSLQPEPLVDQGRVTFWWHDRTNNGALGVQSVTLDDTAMEGDARVTAGMVAMANVFMRHVPGRDVHLIMLVQSGTQPREVMDDAFVPNNPEAPKRRWQDDWAVHDAATADGVPVQWGWHSWFAGPGAYADDHGKAFAAYLWGRDEAGNLLTYSEASPLGLTIGADTWAVSRTLRDMFGGDGPAWVAMGGSHRFEDYSSTDLQSATTYAGGGVQANFLNKERATRSWRALAESAAFAGRVSRVGMHLNAHSIGEPDGAGGWQDGTHPSGWTDDGINYRARQTAHAILRGAGVTGYGLPVIDNAEWQPDGSYMEFWSSAGPITTLRAAAGDPALPGTYPHWTEVLGVQVDGEPAQNTGLAAGRVRVYPNSGVFTSLSRVSFGEGGGSGNLLFPEDSINALYRDFPIVDVGLTDVPGLPLAHLPDGAVMASTVPGLPTFTSTESGPYFADPATVPAGTGAITLTADIALASEPVDNSPTLFSINGLQLRLQPVLPNNFLRMTVKDNSGTTLVNNVSSANGVFTTDVLTTFTCSADLAAGYARVWVDSELVIEETFSSTAPAFQTSRRVALLAEAFGSDQSKGTVQRAAAWFEATPDGTLPGGPPHGEIAGGAATVNAHPWKQGADAV